MGRFLNPNISAANSPLWLGSRKDAGAVLETAAPVDVAPVTVPMSFAGPTAVQVVGLVALSLYLISAWATDLSYRFLGTKPYISMVTGILVFLCFIISGKALAALRTTTGKLWFGLGIWMILSIIFSRWRGGSFALMQEYFPKQHLVPLYMAAFAVTVSNCRTLMRAVTVGGFGMLISCFLLGAADESGRFCIPSNMWLGNPNDLAMQIVLFLGFALFWIRQTGKPGRFAGAILMAGSFYFLPKTGSRGGMISALVFVMVCVFFSKKRIPMFVATVLAGTILILLTPGQTIQRLKTLTADPQTADTEEKQKAVSSQLEREHLLRAAIGYTFRNPIFGVGPGEFADALWEDGKKQGVHEASLGPHNTYAQVAAECGIPGLAMFTLAIVTTIRSSYRLYRATAENKDQAVVAAMSFSCFAMMVAFAIDLFFHHVAYSGNLGIILGIWICLENAVTQAGINFEAKPQTA